MLNESKSWIFFILNLLKCTEVCECKSENDWLIGKETWEFPSEDVSSVLKATKKFLVQKVSSEPRLSSRVIFALELMI